MSRKPSAFDLLTFSTTYWSLVAEANTVIALRTLGMMGLWNTAPNENSRMVAEKTEAFTQSVQAAGRAVARGARPDQIAMAGMKPLRGKTRPNAARLTKAGPKTTR